MKTGPKPMSDAEWQALVQCLGHDEYTLVSPAYPGHHIKTTFIHTICQTSHLYSPHDFISGRRCKVCHHANQSRPGIALSKEEMQTKINDRHGMNVYTLLSASIQNVKTHTEVRHEDCGTVFTAKVYQIARLVKPRQCPSCFAAKWTHGKYVSMIATSFEGDQYVPIEEYAGSNTPRLMKHKICNTEFRVTPTNFLNQGTRCPTCSTIRNSRLQRKVMKILEELIPGRFYVDYSPANGPRSARNRPLRFDFWIPSLNSIIEVDGKLHEQPWKDSYGREGMLRLQDNDRLKDEWATANKLTLLRIHYKSKDYDSVIREHIARILKTA
jgi:hypothetical protein